MITERWTFDEADGDGDDDDDDDLPSEVAAADVRLTAVDCLSQAIVDEDVLVLGLQKYHQWFGKIMSFSMDKCIL